jgi:hypothetical protein
VATNITQGLDWQLDLLDHNTVTLLNYTLVQRYRHFTHFAIHYVHYNTCQVFSLRLHCRFSNRILTQLNSAINYIAGEHGCSLLLRYMVFTMLLLGAYSLASNCCVILVTRHTLLLRGRLATVANKRHIACSMHVTVYCCVVANKHSVDPQRAHHNIISIIAILPYNFQKVIMYVPAHSATHVLHNLMTVGQPWPRIPSVRPPILETTFPSWIPKENHCSG